MIRFFLRKTSRIDYFRSIIAWFIFTLIVTLKNGVIWGGIVIYFCKSLSLVTQYKRCKQSRFLFQLDAEPVAEILMRCDWWFGSYFFNHFGQSVRQFQILRDFSLIWLTADITCHFRFTAHVIFHVSMCKPFLITAAQDEPRLRIEKKPFVSPLTFESPCQRTKKKSLSYIWSVNIASLRQKINKT